MAKLRQYVLPMQYQWLRLFLHRPTRVCIRKIAGNFDYLLKVRTSSLASYRTFLGENISTLPHLASTSTYVAMEAVKETVLAEGP